MSIPAITLAKAVLLAWLAAGLIATADAVTAQETRTEPSVAVDPPAAPEHGLGGPEGVKQQLQRQEESESIYASEHFQRWAAPYYDWKAQLKKDHGLSFGLSGYFLGQTASSTTTGRDDAFSGIYRFQGSWEAHARDTSHPGRIDFRVESRNPLGGAQAANDLGAATGAGALNPGFAYSNDFDVDLAVFNWTQTFDDGKAGFAVGRLAFDVYQDAYRFQTFSRGFLNRSFLVNPTIGTTGIGALGAVGGSMVTDSVWLGAQIYDGNAASGEFDTDTIEEGEFLTNVSVGWTPSWDRYKADRVQLTYWHKDERESAGVSSGSGVVLSATYEVAPGIIPFFRWGSSDGGAGVPADNAASVGLEYALRPDQTLSFGAGWADLSHDTYGPNLDDEFVFEASYNAQLSPNLSLMPDVQYLIDPVNAPGESSVWIFGLRAIVTI